MKDLTVLIPAYNEGKTLAKTITEVLNAPRVSEVIVINDGSKDNTYENSEQTKDKIKIINNPINRGKGYSVIEGIKLAKAKYMIIQDADLELLPSSYETLFNAMEKTNADMINGRRDFDVAHVKFISRLASQIIPTTIWVLFGKHIKDVVCGYKLMKTEHYKALNLKSDRFEIETEMIVKALKKNYKIVEVKVPFKPRSIKDGKHVRWHDGLKVLKLLVKYRLGIYN